MRETPGLRETVRRYYELVHPFRDGLIWRRYSYFMDRFV